MAGPISMRVEGTNRVANRFRTAAAKTPERLDAGIQKWAQSIRAKLKSTPYPAKRLNQRYVRTGNLANRWAVEKVKKAAYNIVNRVAYSGYVVGEEQAWMHEGRWWKAKEEMERYTPDLRDDLRQEMMKDFK